MPQYILPPLNVCFACYLQYCHHPLPLHQYTGSTSGPYQSKTATSGPALHIIYRYMQTHAKVKDDCEDEFHLRSQSHAGMQKNPGGMVPCVHADTCTSAYTHRNTDAWMHYKGNSLKSLSREVVRSTALITRLMPRCTQEPLNQPRGYTRRPEHVSSSSTSFPVPLGTGTRLRHAMAALTEMKAGRLLDTLIHYTQFEYG